MGRVRSFETERQTLKIKQQMALLNQNPYKFGSVQGPVWHDAQGKAIALRVVGRSSQGWKNGGRSVPTTSSSLRLP